MSVINLTFFLDEIQSSLRQLPYASNMLYLFETKKEDDVMTFAAEKGADYTGTGTAALWASWLGKSSILEKLLDIGVDSNYADKAGRYLFASSDCFHIYLI